VMFELIGTTVDPSGTKGALRGGEACFGAGLLCPAVSDAMAALGLTLSDLTQVNFVTRSAPLGPVPAEVVQATFYNFHPSAIAAVIPEAWRRASPEAILFAQGQALSGPLSSALSLLDEWEVAELARLSRAATEAIATRREGRPLFAALTSLPWPNEDHLVIWHAGKLLREHRGDGHLATLMVAGLSGIDALVVHEAFDPKIPAGVLRPMRQWSAAAWELAMEDLRTRGWLTDAAEATLTEDGRQRRQWIEDRTDQLAAIAFEPIGNRGIERMTTLGRKVAKALNAAGLGLGGPVRAFSRTPSEALTSEN
jgi:hypothetical protein